jgi:competence protein ComEA
LADGADRDRLNFAEHVMDGQRITVLKIGQSAPEPVGPVANGSASANSPVGPLNINTATAAQLDSLPGVGPATARAIISYRSEHGPFATIEELASVKGIGPAKLTQLKELVRV